MTGNLTTPVNTPDPDALFDEWMSETFADNPTMASALGLSEYDAELGDFSEEAFERRARSVRRWRQRLAELGWAGPGGEQPGERGHGRGPGEGAGARELEEDQRIDAALLCSHLAGEEVMAGWEYWKRDPETYLDPCLWGVSTLFIHHVRPERELVEAAVSRLRQVPALLDHALAQLDPELASALVLERGVASARGGVEFFSNSLPAVVRSEELRAAIIGPALEASAALDQFAGQLSELVSEDAARLLSGRTGTQNCCKSVSFSTWTRRNCTRIGERAWADLDAEMTELAGHVEAGAPDWRAALAVISSDHPATPEELLSVYAAACDQARSFLVERELVTLPEGEYCSIEASPEFLRPVMAVASYQEPPAFSEGGHGHFFVPFPPQGAAPEDVDQLLADNCWSAVPSIAVHEAYPGHHWQLTWSRRTARRLRKVVMTPYFIEGWALYAEAMMRRQGFFASPKEELSHLDARIFRAARVVVDTSLHCGEMGFDDAVTYMMSHTSLPPAVVRAEVSRYCAWPTQAASYLMGAIELDWLCDHWLAEGRGTLRQFHDTVASSPGLPLPLTAQLLFPRPDRFEP